MSVSMLGRPTMPGFSEAEQKAIYEQLERGVPMADIGRRMDPPRDAKHVQGFVRRMRDNGVLDLEGLSAALVSGRLEPSAKKAQRKPPPRPNGHAKAAASEPAPPKRKRILVGGGPFSTLRRMSTEERAGNADLQKKLDKAAAAQEKRRYSEDELRAMIAAFPQDKVTKLPPPPRPEYDTSWDAAAMTKRHGKLTGLG